MTLTSVHRINHDRFLRTIKNSFWFKPDMTSLSGFQVNFTFNCIRKPDNKRHSH